MPSKKRINSLGNIRSMLKGLRVWGYDIRAPLDALEAERKANRVSGKAIECIREVLEVAIRERDEIVLRSVVDAITEQTRGLRVIDLPGRRNS